MSSSPAGRVVGLILLKLTLAMLGITALTTEVATLVERDAFVATNFFSYFTILGNTLVALTFLASAVLTAAGRGGRVDALRGAATVYILVVGIGFVALLSSLEDVAFTAVPWDNIVLHYLVPAGALLDLALDPPRRRLRFGRSLVWLAFPVAYLAYSLVRGAVVDWYPYPFLDASSNGTAGLLIGAGGLLLLGIALTWAVCRISGRSSTAKAG